MSILKLLDFRNYMHKSTEAKPTTWGDIFRFFENQGAVTEAVVKSHLWQPSTAYSVGDVVHAPSLGGYAARCTKAGTSSEAEPTWKKDGNTTDGTVTWAVYKPVMTDNINGLVEPLIADNVENTIKPLIESMIGSSVEDTIKPLIASMFLARMPVGTIIETEQDVNPGTYIGGTWEKMPAGYVTISAGTYTETQDGNAVTYEFKAGNTYGEAAHKLTVGEMPAHSHSYISAPHLFSERDTSKNNIVCTNSNDSTNQMTYSTGSAGGNSFHNNFQQSKAVYSFRRTA